jgi:hypothetical protein
MPVRMLPAVPPLNDNIEMFRVDAPSAAGLRSQVPVKAGAITIDLAFLLGHPDTSAVQQMARRHAYFDERTGGSWDLFFPGYYEDDRPRQAVDQRVTTSKATWWFSPTEFDRMRVKLEGKSSGRWRYSGGADLLLVRTRVPARGNPTVDWSSLVGARLGVKEGEDDLGATVESIMRDIEDGAVVRLPVHGDDSSLGRDLAKGTTVAVVSQIILQLLNLS